MHRRLAAALAMLVTACASYPTWPPDPGPPKPIIEVLPQQEILTPLPLRVRLPQHYGVEYVLALVLTWGSRDWELVELERVGQTWTGEVSCRQVSTITGDTRYYFLALDEAGEVVAGSGSPEWPYVATVVGALPDGPQGLAGEPRPLRCHDPADCPPDFPGCPAYAFLRLPCTSGLDCSSGVCEWDGYCTASEDEYEDGDWALVGDEERLARAVQRARRRFKTANTRRTPVAQ